MGIDTRRPPLPAPTEDPSSMDNDTDQATDLSRRTDRTSYSIPEDGRPITITTGKEVHLNQPHPSQASLLIEYFEGSKSGDKKKPSVRVKVTPSSARRSRGGHDAVQITNIGKDRRPSYTRRISLGSRPESGDKIIIDGTEVSRSTASDNSSRPPVEVEVLNHNSSDLSQNSRDLRFLDQASNISPMPPDSSLDPAMANQPTEAADHVKVSDHTHLEAPSETRPRSLSRDRITQKVLEKLRDRAADGSSRRSRTVEYEPDTKPGKDRKHRSSKSHSYEEAGSVGSTHLSSNPTSSQRSHDNSRILAMVEDTVKRLILPELQQMRAEQKTTRNLNELENLRHAESTARESRTDDLEKTVTKSSSTPDISSERKTSHDRHESSTSHRKSSRDHERVHTRRSSRSSATGSERHPHRSSRAGSVSEEVDSKSKDKRDRKDRRLRDDLAAAVVGGTLTAAALKHHDSKSRQELREERKDRHDRSRPQSDSISETTEKLQYAVKGPPASARESQSYTESTITPELTQHRGHDAYDSISGRSDDVSATTGQSGIDDGHRGHRLPFFDGVTDSELTRESIVSASTERDDERPPPILVTNQRSDATLRSGGTEYRSLSSHSRTPMTARNLGGRASDRSIAEQISERQLDRQDSPAKSDHSALAAAAAGITGIALAHRAAAERRSQKILAEDHASDNISTTRSVSSRVDLDDPLIPQTDFAHTTESIDRGKTYNQSASVLSSRSGRVSPLLPSEPSYISRESQSLAERYDEPRPIVPMKISAEDNPLWIDYETTTKPSQLAGYATNTPEPGVVAASVSSDDKRLSRDVQNVSASPFLVHHPEDHPAAAESAVASLVDPSTISSIQSSRADARTSPRNNALEDRAFLEKASRPSPTHRDSSYQDGARSMRPHASTEETKSVSQGDLVSKTKVSRPVSSSSSGTRQKSRESTPIILGASGLPDVNDPMPEIGHGLDFASEIGSPTSPKHDALFTSEQYAEFLKLGSPAETPAETPADQRLETEAIAEEDETRHSESTSSDQSVRKRHTAEDALAAAAAASEAAVMQSERARRESPLVAPSSRGSPLVDEIQVATHSARNSPRSPAKRFVGSATAKSLTPNQGGYNDEGYVSGAYAPSVGTPKKGKSVLQKEYSDQSLTEYRTAMAETNKRFDRISAAGGLTDARESPFYDSATGRGMGRIESKDVVALMDHLTVRDGQRNARDTEILIGLVQNATDMRQEFDELRRFIALQDKMIMKNTDQNAEATTSKILNAQKAYPQVASRLAHSNYDEESYVSKRKNIFKRALRNLGAGKSSRDDARIEQMLYQLLDDVTTLKAAQTAQPRPDSSAAQSSTAQSQSQGGDGMTSYEALRAKADSGYEPEGVAGTGESPTHDGGAQVSPRAKQTFHSGYDGRRDSTTRVSTVLEGDEGDEAEYERDEQLTPKAATFLTLDSPLLEPRRDDDLLETVTPTRTHFVDDSVESTPERQRKHKSTSSSINFVPKISRWSKTTTSSGPDGYDSRRQSQEQRPLSDGSRSARSSHDGSFREDEYRDESPLSGHVLEGLMSGPRSLRSQQSYVGSTPSPPITATSSRHRHDYEDEYAHRRIDLSGDFDSTTEDPKYRAVRHSVLLQHPQPRPGPTQRHQTNLESQAEEFAPSAGSLSGSDLSQRSVSSEFDPSQWGSIPALSLSRAHKLGKINPDANGSPVRGPAAASPTKPLREQNRGEDARPPARRSVQVQEPLRAHPVDRKYVRSQVPPRTFDRIYYSSPLGSGHLLEPIEEVRYSLETDSGAHGLLDYRDKTPEPSGVPIVDKSKLTPVRKITGPRPMSSSPKGSPTTILRKAGSNRN